MTGDIYLYVYTLLALLILIVTVMNIVIWRLKIDLYQGRTMKLFSIYFIYTLLSVGVTVAKDISLFTLEHESLLQGISFVFSTQILLLAFNDLRLRIRPIRYWSFSVSGAAIVLQVIIEKLDHQMMVLIYYSWIMYTYLFVVAVLRSWRHRNIGYSIFGIGFFVILAAFSYAGLRILFLGDLTNAYNAMVAGSIIGFLSVSLGLLTTVLVHKQKQLETLSLKDPLTDLYNRRGLDHQLQTIPSYLFTNRFCISVIAIDIDYFKKINDSFGHDGGDKVLQEFSLRIKSMLRANDIISRMGGEEFVVVLPNIDSNRAMDFAQRLRREIAEMKIALKGGTVNLSASFGVATGCGYTDMDCLLKNADRALYQSKADGRNCVTLYSDSVEPGNLEGMKPC